MWTSFLVNRLTVSLAGFALIGLALNVYVAFHDDGVLAGQVVGPSGRPVSGAEVTLYMPGIVGLDIIETKKTDEDGHFRFEKHDQHHPALQAKKENLGESGLVRVRLYFRNQNRTLKEPIRLMPESPPGSSSERARQSGDVG